MKDTCTLCVLKKNRIVHSVCRSCSDGWSVEASTTLMDQMMGIQCKSRKYEKVFSEIKKYVSDYVIHVCGFFPLPKF
jgi:hypothetical protein